jgi:ATP adenylyltransferase
MEFPKEQVESLWAPWRVEYFETKDQRPDFLLEAAQASDDEAHLVIARGRSCFLIMNRYPYSAGHLMAVPQRKVASLSDLSDQEKLELLEFVELAQRLLRDVVKAQGYNVGVNLGVCAGAGAPDHLHVHIVPRWSGDSNFMAVLGGTRVIPEGLSPLYSKLRDAIARVR